MSKKAKRKQVIPKQGQGSIKKAGPARTGKRIDYYLVILGIIVVSIALIRLRLVGIPLERDEGEYAFIGKSLLQGIAPYQEAYSMKLPGTYFMYAVIMELFGKSISGIHYGLLLLNSATIIFFFLGFRKIFNSSIALFAASVYGMMSISPSVLGFAAHATHFVTFFVSVGIFFLARYYANKRLLNAFLTGLMFGLAFLMKQQAVFFLLFGGIAIIMGVALEKPFRMKPVILNALVYSAGVIIPYGITILILMAAGVFDKFWFWTVQYASKYAVGAPWKQGKVLFDNSFKGIWSEFAFFWIFFFAGMVLTFLTKFTLKQKLTAILFALFAFLAVCPGLYFRKHYFISFLPAIGLLGAIAVWYLSNLAAEKLKMKWLSFLPFIIFCIVSIAALSKQKDYYFKSEPDEISLMIYGNNPFVESIEIARYVKENSTKQDTIAVLGSEPQIYLYADRHSATGYIYTYGLMEIQKYNLEMQEEMIAEIEKVKPKFIVFCSVSASWLVRPDSPMRIFEWFNTYARANYDLVGIADITGDQTIYKWNADAIMYKPQSKDCVFVYKKK